MSNNTDVCAMNTSYECACINGFAKSESSLGCIAIKECTTSSCHGSATCTNSNGDFTCECNSGFAGDGFKCENINECDDSSMHKCHKKAICKDEIGSFSCE